jgi:hypothetical protein
MAIVLQAGINLIGKYSVFLGVGRVVIVEVNQKIAKILFVFGFDLFY